MSYDGTYEEWRAETGAVTSPSKPDDTGDLLKLALYRCETFDIDQFLSWLLVQPAKLAKTANEKRPNRIYRGPQDLLYFIRGYGKMGHVVLGFVMDPDGANLHADPSEIEDVTDDVRSENGLI